MLERALPVALEDLLARDVSLPVCPVVFIKLTEALEHADDRSLDLSSILSADTALTSQVLRAANSAVYGLVRQVRSVDEAIFRIGFREVWAIAAALKAKELFRATRPEWTRMANLLWEHAIKVGSIARALAKHAVEEHASELFTAGILHDLGKLLLHQLSPQYALLADNGALRGRALTLREQDFFGTRHARIGAEMLRRWNLPESLAKLVDQHHQENLEGAAQPKELALLMLANELAHALDAAPAAPATPEGTDIPAPALPAVCLQAVALDPQLCWTLARESQRQIASLNLQ